jgi:hypothetical protein
MPDRRVNISKTPNLINDNQTKDVPRLHLLLVWLLDIWRVPKKKCRTLPAEGLGVFPQTKKSPKIGGFRGLNTAFSVL